MLLMVNSIRGRIFLMVCDIFLRKEAENLIAISEDTVMRKQPFIRSRSSKVIDFGTNGKRVYPFLLVINNNFSQILHCFVDMAAKMPRIANFAYPTII